MPAPAASHPGRVLLGVMLGIFLAAMESTVVATAMPRVVESLGRVEMYSWVFSAFLLASTVTMPLWGRLADLLGRRPAYLAGLALFLAGSALAGAAWSMAALIAFRALQGLGAGALLTVGMTIVGDLFGLERRARMQGYLSGVWGVASVAGPLVGGLLADYVSWRWVFYVNLPVGALAMAVIAGALVDHAPRPAVRIDWTGLGTFAAGMTALLLGVLAAGRSGSWLTPEGLVLLAFALVALVVFVRIEARARQPIVPLRLFANPLVRAAVVTGFLSGMAMFGALSFVPLFMQAVVGASATEAGWVLTPFVLGWIALSITSARLVLRTGYRAVVFAGMGCLTGAFLLFARWDAGLARATAMRDVLVAGVGMGLLFVPMLIAVQSAVPRDELGAATALTQFFRTLGGTIGLSVMGTVMAQQLGAGRPLAEALHAVFTVGLGVGAVACVSAFLVPAGGARELARPERVGVPEHGGR